MQPATARVSPARVFARPEAGDIWLGSQQRTALEAFARPAPLRVLIGPPDSGKTTLVRHWSSQRDLVLTCRGPKRDAAGVLAQLLGEAHLTSLGLGEIDQRNLFTVFVQQRRSQGRRVFVAVDDADRLEERAWQEIARLLAWRFEKRPVLDVLLAGSPALLQALRAIRPFEPDSATIVCLAGAARDDVRDYLDWRVARFALQAELTAPAKDAIAEVARGRYSTVDVLAQMALLLAECREQDIVDSALVHDAAAALAARRIPGGRLPPLRSGERGSTSVSI